MLEVNDRVPSFELAHRLLRTAMLRPTKQRLALANLIFSVGPHHVTAESLHSRVRQLDNPISLATVYNTLNQFVERGLLREIHIDAQRTFFDTNMEPHYHFFNKTTGHIEDVSTNDVCLTQIPIPPKGTVIDKIDVIFHVESDSK